MSDNTKVRSGAHDGLMQELTKVANDLMKVEEHFKNIPTHDRIEQYKHTPEYYVAMVGMFEGSVSRITEISDRLNLLIKLYK